MKLFQKRRSLFLFLCLIAGTLLHSPLSVQSAETVSAKSTSAVPAEKASLHNTPQTALPLSLNKPCPGNSTSVLPEFYTVTLPEAGALQLKFSHALFSSSGNGFLISLYKKDLYTQPIYTISNSNTSVSESAPWIGLSEGTYYISVTCKNTSFSQEGIYTLEADYQKSAGWEQEPNDTFAQATPITVNAAYLGSSAVCSRLSDKDCYKFTLPSAGSITLRFLHPLLTDYNTTYYDISLYDSAGKSCFVSASSLGTDQKQSFSPIGLAAGTYYLNITCRQSTLESYCFNLNFKASDFWEKENNDTLSLADIISANSTYHGSFPEGTRDDDFYRFSLKDNGYIQLTFSHSGIPSSIGSNAYAIYLLDHTGTKISCSYSDGSDTKKTYYKTGLPGGTYYLRIVNIKSDHTPYAFRINYKKSSAWESENNNAAGAADKLPLGKSISGVSMGGEYDYYKFTLSKTAYVSASLTHASTGTGDITWYMELLNSSGSVFSKDAEGIRFGGWFKSRGIDHSISTGNLKLKKGSYYIRIHGYDATPYSIQVSTVKASVPKVTDIASSGWNSVKLKWNSVPGASRYFIYRSTSKNGDYQKIAAPAGSRTSYTDQNLTAGKTYYYKLRTQVVTGTKTKTSAFSQIKSCKPVPSRVSIQKNTAGKTTASLVWKKVSGASGYELYRSTSPKGNYKKIAAVNRTSYKNKKLKSGKTYYYKIRAYRTVNKKNIYGRYSKIISIKVK